MLGYSSVALIDFASVAGGVEFMQAAKEHGIKAVLGATLEVAIQIQKQSQIVELVLLAKNRDGYQHLCELITLAFADGNQAQPIALQEIIARAANLVCLTGGRAGLVARLLAKKQIPSLQTIIKLLKNAFADDLYIQLFHSCYPGDAKRVRIMRRLAQSVAVTAVAAPEVLYATPDLYKLQDALTCARLGITVDTPHAARPRNDASAIPLIHDLQNRFPNPETIQNTAILLNDCTFELLPERLTPPKARVPMGETPDSFLESRVRAQLKQKYRAEVLPKARERLSAELLVVQELQLAEFFLVAAEVTDYCRAHGILAAGRGSAAGSVLCYLLGITLADPIQHNLLFERFLHTGKRTMPDVDIDIASSRRDEVLAWVERRFNSSNNPGVATEAMVANRITYRLPSAITDLGRALGLPIELVHKLTKSLGRDHRHKRPHHARCAQIVFDEVLADAPVKEILIGLLESIEPGFVRHLAPHSGGVILSDAALQKYSPTWRSSGGLRVMQFNKDDVEALGLIKLDFLALRMLGALEQARELILERTGLWLELHDLPDDQRVWKRIQAGDTLGMFQIESPGQMILSRQLRAANMEDLAHQVALFRPGPIQSGTVHPYLDRRAGKQKVSFLHPVLKPILEKTQGVILFQEQVLRIAVHFAGMNWIEADKFRKQVSSWEDEADLLPFKQKFVDGAKHHVNATESQAAEVFAMCSAFQGYGFAESHAWAFAMHAYASAYLREHHPLEYMCAFLQESPGMWSRNTLRQEAKKWQVDFLGPDINKSTASFRIEDNKIRIPFTAIAGISSTTAHTIVLERLQAGHYTGVENLVERTNLKRDQLEALVRAGALDSFNQRRENIFALGERILAAPRTADLFVVPKTEMPKLAALDPAEQMNWELATIGLSVTGLHPMDFVRHQVQALGCTALLATKSGQTIRTAGLVISKQKPPTANGFAFYSIEDGPSRMQVIISPDVWSRDYTALRDARILIVDGVHQGTSIKASKVFLFSANGKILEYEKGAAENFKATTR